MKLAKHVSVSSPANPSTSAFSRGLAYKSTRD